MVRNDLWPQGRHSGQLRTMQSHSPDASHRGSCPRNQQPGYSHHQSLESMSTAVLISGQMRTVKRCSAYIRAAFPTADIYVHAVMDHDAHFAERLNPVRLVIEPQGEMPERREYTWQLGRGCHGVQRVLKQLHGLKRVWEIYEMSGHHHDWIVRCRSDLFFNVLPEPEENRGGNVIMVPKFANYWGLNDRFAMMRPWVARMYFPRINLLDRYINAGGIFHPESFLSWSIQGVQIDRTRANFDTIRPDGSRDLPFFNPDHGDLC